MHDAWQAMLQAGRVLLTDGGTGSELRRRGMRLDDAVWSGLASLTHYELLRGIHADYIAAGADVITTNTFATSRFVLEAAQHGDRFDTVNRRAVEAARVARDAGGREVAIAGSMSSLPPHFDTAAYPAPLAEYASYVELAEVLASAGVDLLALEMLQDLEHARLLCDAARTVGLPLWLGVSCRLQDEALVAFDFPSLPLAAVLDALLPYKPAAITVMHSPALAIAPALRAIRERWSGVAGAYPELGDGAPGRRPLLAPRTLASLAATWTKNGALIVGGCCGTTPEHIGALREMLDRGPAQGGSASSATESD